MGILHDYSVCALSRAKILTFWSISKESTCNIVESIVMKQLYTDIWYVPVYRFKNNKPLSLVNQYKCQKHCTIITFITCRYITKIRTMFNSVLFLWSLVFSGTRTQFSFIIIVSSLALIQLTIWKSNHREIIICLHYRK